MQRDKLDPVTGEIMLDQDGMPQTEEVENLQKRQGKQKRRNLSVLGSTVSIR